MPEPKPPLLAPPFTLTGGALCLDLANTLDRPAAAAMAGETLAGERLREYRDLVCWAEQAGAIPLEAGKRLRAEADRRPGAAESALAGARAFREELYGIFSALAGGRPAPAQALAMLNAALAPAFARRRLTGDEDRFGWQWDFDDRALDGVLAPVVESAASLLTSPDLARVRECEAADCAWLFLDRSRNGSRRWCDMSACGNRAKVRRHYARARASAPR
ncbi:MAG TPA: ABATE domain-containing protein [Vicinamibacterales bacterium]|nr:ABATE domain-containing protein [Vicinamibacterales bacterium]